MLGMLLAHRRDRPVPLIPDSHKTYNYGKPKSARKRVYRHSLELVVTIKSLAPNRWGRKGVQQHRLSFYYRQLSCKLPWALKKKHRNTSKVQCLRSLNVRWVSQLSPLVVRILLRRRSAYLPVSLCDLWSVWFIRRLPVIIRHIFRRFALQFTTRYQPNLYRAEHKWYPVDTCATKWGCCLLLRLWGPFWRVHGWFWSVSTAWDLLDLFWKRGLFESIQKSSRRYGIRLG